MVGKFWVCQEENMQAGAPPPEPELDTGLPEYGWSFTKLTLFLVLFCPPLHPFFFVLY